MKALKSLFFFIAGLMLSAASVTAQTVTFIPVSAPDASTSPNFNAWLNNAAYAAAHNSLTAGTPGTPAYFDATDQNILSSEIIRTPTFNSWNGYANPGTVFGSAFANEHGNAYRTIFVIERGASQFKVTDVTATFRVDPGTSTGSTINVNGLLNYSGTSLGVLYGADGLFGTADDTYVASGSTALVDALVFTGLSNTFIVSPTGLTDQERLNNSFSPYSQELVDVKVYMNSALIGQHDQTFIQAAAIPEPWFYAAIFGVIALGFAALQRYRSKALSRPS